MSSRMLVGFITTEPQRELQGLFFFFFFLIYLGVPAVAQWVKDLALLQLWYKLQLQLCFDPWPGNFHMPWMQPKK